MPNPLRVNNFKSPKHDVRNEINEALRQLAIALRLRRVHFRMNIGRCISLRYIMVGGGPGTILVIHTNRAGLKLVTTVPGINLDQYRLGNGSYDWNEVAMEFEAKQALSVL